MYTSKMYWYVENLLQISKVTYVEREYFKFITKLTVVVYSTCISIFDILLTIKTRQKQETHVNQQVNDPDQVDRADDSRSRGPQFDDPQVIIFAVSLCFMDERKPYNQLGAEADYAMISVPCDSLTLYRLQSLMVVRKNKQSNKNSSIRFHDYLFKEISR